VGAVVAAEVEAAVVGVAAAVIANTAGATTTKR
jgi:hypothetical protein